MNNKKITIFIAAAIFLKSILFIYAESHVPELKIRNDTHWYLESGLSLVSDGIFGKTNEDGTITYQYYRTPGYPLFLGILHGWLKIPLSGVIALQVLLTILSAMIVFKTANRIDPRLGTLSFFIILFDPAITIYSLMLLSETLFLLFMCIFMFQMTTYMQKNEKKHLFLSALALAAATYIRPISIYLGGILVLFLLAISFQKSFKKSIVHVCIFLITLSSLLFIWQWRNHNHFGKYQFSKVEGAAIQYKGIYKSYSRNEDPYSQGLTPIPYYINVTSRSLMSLWTRPASFKYFESNSIKRGGKIFSYLWITFWMAGFIGGISKMKKDRYFYFFLLVIIYFSATSVIGVMWIADARFRVPMMPFIAILSAYGWTHLSKTHLNAQS